MGVWSDLLAQLSPPDDGKRRLLEEIAEWLASSSFNAFRNIQPSQPSVPQQNEQVDPNEFFQRQLQEQLVKRPQRWEI